MGLDTSHGCWYGAYSAFMRFRECVAEAAGVPLHMMEGFYCEGTSAGPPSKAAMDWIAPREGGPECRHFYGPILHYWIERMAEYLPLSWDLFDGDALVAFLNHSDSDGEIPAEQCGPIADRLEELREEIIVAARRRNAEGGHLRFIGEAVDQWVVGLRAAAAAGEAVEFG